MTNRRTVMVVGPECKMHLFAKKDTGQIRKKKQPGRGGLVRRTWTRIDLPRETHVTGQARTNRDRRRKWLDRHLDLKVYSRECGRTGRT